MHISQVPPNPALFAPRPAFLYIVVNDVPSIGKQVMIGHGIGTRTKNPAQRLPGAWVCVRVYVVMERVRWPSKRMRGRWWFYFLFRSSSLFWALGGLSGPFFLILLTWLFILFKCAELVMSTFFWNFYSHGCGQRQNHQFFTLSKLTLWESRFPCGAKKLAPIPFIGA